MNLKIRLKLKIQYFFLRLFHLKFYARQNYPPINAGYDSLHLKKIDNAYFHGNITEFELFHNKMKVK